MSRILAIVLATVVGAIGCFGVGHCIADRWIIQRTWNRLPSRPLVAWAPEPRHDRCPVDLRTPLFLSDLHAGVRAAGGDVGRYVEGVFRCEREPEQRAGFLAMLNYQAKADTLADRAFDHIAHHLCTEFAELAGATPAVARNGRLVCPEILRLAASYREPHDDHRRILTSRIAQLTALLESGVTQPDVTTAFCAVIDVAEGEGGTGLPERLRDAYAPLVTRYCGAEASADAGTPTP